MLPATEQLGQVERVRRNLNGLSDDDKASLVRRSMMASNSGVKGCFEPNCSQCGASFCDVVMDQSLYIVVLLLR